MSVLGSSLDRELQNVLGSPVQGATRVSGGDINDAFCIRTSGGEFFLKVQAGKKGAAMFSSEQNGLRELARCGSVAVPQPLAAGSAQDGVAFLLMSWHQPIQPGEQNWQKLGEQLAGMHRYTGERFGFYEDNFIGSLPQSNSTHLSWDEFFAEERIEPMLEMSSAYLDKEDFDNWYSIRKKLSDLIGCDAPSLLHGDLWGGNAMHTHDGPLIYDPAVYYGDRLVDIAMTRLFGGFPSAFYKGYFSTYPVSGAELDRLPLYQLYYLLVHLALFGRSYLGQCRSILHAFT